MWMCSFLVPSKPRFSDPGDKGILREVQPQRSDLVHEQWQLPFQHHRSGQFLLHQRPMCQISEASHFRFWEWILRWRRRPGFCALLSHGFRRHSGPGRLCIAVASDPGFHGFSFVGCPCACYVLIHPFCLLIIQFYSSENGPNLWKELRDLSAHIFV